SVSCAHYWRPGFSHMSLPSFVRNGPLVVVLFLSSCLGAAAPTQQQDRVHLLGALVEGGAECQRFRSSDNKYYTLDGDLRGFRTGDRVEITGTLPPASHCMQDTTIHVETIRRLS